MVASSALPGREPSATAPPPPGAGDGVPGQPRPSAAAAVWKRVRAMWARSRLKGISAYPSLSAMDWDAISRRRGVVCQHAHYQNHCVLYAFGGLARGFLVGYGLRSAFTLATSLFSPRVLRSPLRVLLGAALSRRSLRFAVFLGAMGFVYRNLQCVLCKVLGRPSKRGSAAAAFVAGLAVLLETREQRSTLAGFLFVRAVYETVRTLAHNGYVAPRRFALPVAFGLCQVPIMYAFQREPRALNRGYLKWITRMGSMSPEQIHHVIGATNRQFNPCQPFFHQNSCVAFNANKFLEVVFLRATQVYLPVHLVPPLLFKTKHVLARPGAYLAESALAVLRSSLFLGTYVGCVSVNLCFWRWFLQRNSSAAVRFGGLTTGAALLFEHPRRHGEMVQYVIPRAVETWLNLHSASLPAWFNWLRSSGVGDLALFCSAMAMFVLCADTQPRLKGLNATIFRLLFGHGTAMLRPSAPASPAAGPRRLPGKAGAGAADADPDVVDVDASAPQ